MYNIKRWSIYIAGLIILAAGIMLNTRTTLGVSPIISVGYAASQVSHQNFGNVTLIWYTLFVCVEIIIHLTMRGSDIRQRIILDIAQIPLSIVFTRLMNLLGGIIPEFETDCAGTFAGSLPGRILLLLVAIILTGIGAAMSLNVRLIPNPGDGVVQAVADLTGHSTGITKNFWDLGCVSLTVIFSLTMSGHIIGIGIGTVLALIGVGRVIAIFNHFALTPIQTLTSKSGATEESTAEA